MDTKVRLTELRMLEIVRADHVLVDLRRHASAALAHSDLIVSYLALWLPSAMSTASSYLFFC